MSQLFKKFCRQLLSFVCDQYIVLFLILTTAYKQFLFNSNILNKGEWLTPQIFFIIFSSAVIFSPLFFIRRHKNKIAILLSFFISFLLIVDTVYFSYFSALPSVGLLGSLGQTESIGPAIVALIEWWFILYFIDIALVLISYKPLKKFFDKLRIKFKIKKTDIKTTWVIFALLLVGLWVSLMNIGGIG